MSYQIEESVDETFDIAAKFEKKTKEQLALKLTEEAGEVSEAVLSAEDAPGCGYKGKGPLDVKEEAVDTILCAIALFGKYGGTKEELAEIMHRKNQKWLTKALNGARPS